MNPHYTYLFIMLASLAGPLALSFDRKVAFYRQWKSLVLGMLPPALFYILWDMWFTDKSVWWFTDAYITGIKLYNLPIEEVMFFFIVPYCCVFIYQCVRIYFPRLQSNNMSRMIFLMMGIVLLITAIIHHDKAYTFFTFLFNAIFIACVFIFKNQFRNFNTTAFLIAYLIILIPFLIVNGLLTSIPVVNYDNAENLAFRIYTIPFEDIFYGMLLIMMNVICFEFFSNKRSV